MRKSFAWMVQVVLAMTSGAVAAEPQLVEDFEAGYKAERWTFFDGREFPGASGQFQCDAEAAHGGQFGGRLRFDFSGGGSYVAAICRLDRAPDVAAFRVWLKKPAGHTITFRYTDQTSQTLQKQVFALDDRWCDVLIGVDGFSSHWGGANDGQIHGPPKVISIGINNAGAKSGNLLFDDLRLIEGKPGSEASANTVEYVAYRFDPAEGWTLRGGAAAGRAKFDDRLLQYDFTQGGAAVTLAPPDRGLLGTPVEFTVRARGGSGQHPVRLRLGTHFMTFEKTLGPLAGPGECEVSTAAPPGPGWTFHNGENDGKIHGPLRITGVLLEKGDEANAGELQLLEIRVKAKCSPQRCCVLTAQTQPGPAGKQFVATVHSMSPKPIDGLLTWVLRDWESATLLTLKQPIRIPGPGEMVESAIPVPSVEHTFIEAEVSLEAADQLTPPAQAYDVAPIQSQEDAKLDPASPFGMGLYLCRYSGDANGLAQMDQAARLAAEAGVKWSREDITWPRIEGRPGVYDFNYYDKLVATAKRHGISIYGLLAGWGPGVKPYTPEGLDAYCRWAAAVVDRYRNDIRHWEVWNEPNIFFWQGPKDMYAELLKRAYAAIKQANPDALVLGCSTAGIDYKFIRRTLELGSPMDVLTIHPYRTTLDDRVFAADLTKAADIVKLPDGRPREVWITEMGWTTFVPHNSLGQDFAAATQRQQAQLLARAYLDAIASGVAPNISWYDFRNDGTDPTNFEHNMGVITRDFVPKPAYRALATMAQLLKGKRPAGQVDLGPDVVAYRFEDAQHENAVYALWSLDAKREVTLPAAAEAKLIDLMGNSTALKPTDGKVSIQLKPLQPTFVLMRQ